MGTEPEAEINNNQTSGPFHPEYPGWVQRGNLRIYELTSGAPGYPEEWRSDEEERARQALDASRFVRDLISRLQHAWSGRMAIIEQVAHMAHEGERRLTFSGDPALVQQAQEHITELNLVLYGAAHQVRTTVDAPLEVVVAYLARRLIPDNLAPYWDEPPSPMQLMANAEDREIVMVALHPGEWMLKGDGLSRKDVAVQAGRFITVAQRIAGRRSRKRGPEPNIDKAAAVAQRGKDRPDLTAAQICDELGISYTDSESARQTVRYWLRRAKTLGLADSPSGGDKIG